MKEHPIVCWVSDGCAWIRICGDGTHINAVELKDFARKRIRSGTRQFVIDMQECPNLDSTFMGTMAGISLRLREIGEGSVQLVNVSAKQRRELKKLGIADLFVWTDLN